MNYKKKERLYISDIIENPPITYPMYYVVSSFLKDDEMLHAALFAIHLNEFDNHKIPDNISEVFSSLSCGTYPIYKEQYVVGEFAGRLMYLESAGWRSMVVTKDVFEVNNWLI